MTCTSLCFAAKFTVYIWLYPCLDVWVQTGHLTFTCFSLLVCTVDPPVWLWYTVSNLNRLGWNILCDITFAISHFKSSEIYLPVVNMHNDAFCDEKYSFFFSFCLMFLLFVTPSCISYFLPLILQLSEVSIFKMYIFPLSIISVF